jgi:hypothetical protein
MYGRSVSVDAAVGVFPVSSVPYLVWPSRPARLPRQCDVVFSLLVHGEKAMSCAGSWPVRIAASERVHHGDSLVHGLQLRRYKVLDRQRKAHRTRAWCTFSFCHLPAVVAVGGSSAAASRPRKCRPHLVCPDSANLNPNKRMSLTKLSAIAAGICCPDAANSRGLFTSSIGAVSVHVSFPTRCAAPGEADFCLAGGCMHGCAHPCVRGCEQARCMRVEGSSPRGRIGVKPSMLSVPRVDRR